MLPDNFGDIQKKPLYSLYLLNHCWEMGCMEKDDDDVYHLQKKVPEKREEKFCVRQLLRAKQTNKICISMCEALLPF